MDKYENDTFRFFKTIHDQLDLTLFDYGYIDTNHLWNYQQITSSFNRLYFIIDGEGTISNGQKETLLKPGFAYLIPLNTTYNYNCNEHLVKFYIHFRMDIYYFKDMFEVIDSIIQIPYDQELFLSYLEKAKNNHWAGTIALKAFMLQYLAKFSETIPMGNQQNIEIALKYQPLFNFIKSNCTLRLTLKEVAEHFNLPLADLTKAFKRDVGITLKNYIYSVIIQSAKDQLLLTDKMIKEISFNLGFSDEFYFSRFFKHHTSISPKFYRKQNKLCDYVLKGDKN